MKLVPSIVVKSAVLVAPEPEARMRVFTPAPVTVNESPQRAVVPPSQTKVHTEQL